MKPVFLLLILALAAIPGRAQSAPAAALSTDEIIAQLLASRPKAKRTLVPPKLFDSLDEKSEEQSVLPTDTGMSAWRDTYGKDGNETFGFRQYFVPLKNWKQKTPKQMLDDAKAQMTGGRDAPALEQRDYTLDDFPCRTFVIKNPATGQAARLDYVLIYPDLFIVSYSGTEEGLKSPRVAKFFSELKTAPVK